MNKVMLTGNLTKDPEMRTTSNNVSACTFTVAVQREYAGTDGKREADFISCVAWRTTADFIGKHFTKGKRIGLWGKLQSRSYDAQDGSKRYVTEVIVDGVEFEGKNGGDDKGLPEPPPEKNDTPMTQVEDDDELPF